MQDLVVSTAQIRDTLGYNEIANAVQVFRDNIMFHAIARLGRPYVKGY